VLTVLAVPNPGTGHRTLGSEINTSVLRKPTEMRSQAFALLLLTLLPLWATKLAKRATDIRIDQAQCLATSRRPVERNRRYADCGARGLHDLHVVGIFFAQAGETAPTPGRVRSSRA
jgi:hypothetical protein